MAQRPRITDQSDDDTPAIEAAYDDVSGLVDAQERMENEINAEIGAPDNDVRWLIKVYRVEATGKELTYLFQIIGESIEGLSDRLRDEYGSGKYMVRVYRNSKLHKAPVLKVEAAKNRVPTSMDHGGSALVQSVAQQGAILQTLVQEIVAIKRAPTAASSPIDPLGMMSAMAGMMKEMRSLMPEPPKALPPPDPMAIMSTAIEMAKSLQDGGREKSMIEVVAEFMQSDLMKTVVQNAQAQQAAPPPQIQQPRPRPQIQPPPGTTPQNPQPKYEPPLGPAPQQNPDEAKFAALLEMLVTRAANKSDPVLYADFIEDMIDRPTLEGLMSLPDPVGTLIQYNPAVATYREWFVQLIEALTDGGEGVEPESALDVTAEPSRASGNGPAPLSTNVAT